MSVGLAFMLLVLATTAAIYWGGYFLTPLLALLILLLSRYWLEFATEPRSPVVLIAMGVVAGITVWLAIRYHMRTILPPLLLGCLLLMLRRRYVPAKGRPRTISEIILSLYIVAATAYMVAHLPYHYWIFTFFMVAVAIVILNNRFYFFLAAKRGRIFVLAAIPFNLLYHIYNGISFVAGLAHYSWMKVLRKQHPVPDVMIIRRES